jgi:hypothetical protein
MTKKFKGAKSRVKKVNQLPKEKFEKLKEIVQFFIDHEFCGDFLDPVDTKGT